MFTYLIRLLSADQKNISYQLAGNASNGLSQVYIIVFNLHSYPQLTPGGFGPFF